MKRWIVIDMLHDRYGVACMDGCDPGVDYKLHLGGFAGSRGRLLAQSLAERWNSELHSPEKANYPHHD